MPGFVLKVLTADVAKRWRQRFCAVATITTKGDRMVIAVGKGEPRVIANYKGRWFHISLGCVRWVVGFKSFSDQQQLLQCSCQQRQRNHITCLSRHLRLVAEKRRKSDYSDSGISASRFRDALCRTHFRMEVAAMLLRLCRRVGSLPPTNLRALPQFDGSAADQSQSPRALS